MSDPVQDGFNIFLLAVVLLLMIVGIFVMPLFALAMGSLYVPYIIYKKYQNNPVRLEKEAEEYNQLIYKKALMGALGNFDEVAIQERLGSKLPSHLPEHIRFHLMACARATLDMLNIAKDIPPPPPVANSIEGGRWRDKIASLGGHSPQEVGKVIDILAEVIRKVSLYIADTKGRGSLIPVRIIVGNELSLFEAIADEVVGASDLLKPIEDKLDENYERLGSVMPRDSTATTFIAEYFAGTPLAQLLNFATPVVMSPELRSSHHLIVASTGSGKSTLFESMIVDDLTEDAAIIVIDSHGEFLERIAERVDPSRLIWFDPEFVTPALNLFARGENDEASIGRTLAMFDYIFASKGVEFTTNQARLYRSLSRLCMSIPGASLVTMREMCKPKGTLQYQETIDTLDENTRSFFAEYHQKNHGMYGGTREEVLGRLQTALDNTTFAKMLGSATMKLDILKEIEAGKVILVNTDRDRLQSGANLFGRIMLGLVMQAVQSRKPNTGKQVYLYADEFGQDYAQDSDLMISMFSQLRKYRLGMVVVAQQLDQIPQKLYASIASNTAIRMAAEVSELDEGAVANMLRSTVKELRSLPKYSFMAYLRGIGTFPWRVEKDRLLTLTKNSPAEMKELRERMRREYGENLRLPPPPEPKPEPPPSEEFEEVDFLKKP